jgi:hypothetical protein
MNNTRTLAIVAVLMAATLVVGTFAATAATQSAFAYSQKKPDKARDNGSGNRNGNTITALKCQNKGFASGWDTKVNQECENTICTHPGDGATCVSEGGTAGGNNNGAACEACFAGVSLSALIAVLNAPIATGGLGFNVHSFADICALLDTHTITTAQLTVVLGRVTPDLTDAQIAAIIQCLLRLHLLVSVT